MKSTTNQKTEDEDGNQKRELECIRGQKWGKASGVRIRSFTEQSRVYVEERPSSALE